MNQRKANFVCVDIGSHKIATLAAHISSADEVEIMGHGLYASEGIKSGVIFDSPKFELCLSNALNNLEQKIKHHIESVVVAFSGARIRSNYLDYSLSIDSRAITKNDVSLLVAKGVRSANSKDLSVVHCFPFEFLVDGVKVRNPVGMVCEKLSSSLHVLTSDANALLNLSSSFAKSHVRVEEFSAAPISSGFAYFSCNTQDKGGIVIDFGARTTTMSVFYDNTPVFVDYVPIGAWHVSNDIAQVLSLNFQDAERLKILHANVGEENPELVLDLDIYDQDRVIDGLVLSEVARSRMIEILQMVKQKYDQIDNVDPIAARNLILTGGGSAIRGLEALAGSIMQISRVRDFARHYSGHLLAETDIQSYAAVLGMLSYRMNNYINYYSSASLLKEKSSLLKKFVSHIKELF